MQTTTPQQTDHLVERPASVPLPAAATRDPVLTAEFANLANALWLDLIQPACRPQGGSPPVFEVEIDGTGTVLLLRRQSAEAQQSGLAQVRIEGLARPGILKVSAAATILHALVHFREGTAVKDSYRDMHSAWFRTASKQLGLGCAAWGCRCAIKAPSPFTEWVKAHGLYGATFPTGS